MSRSGEREPREIEREERAIYVIMTLALSPILIAFALRGGGTIDAGMTLSFAIAALGVIGIIAGIRRVRRDRLPSARALRR